MKDTILDTQGLLNHESSRQTSFKSTSQMNLDYITVLSEEKKVIFAPTKKYVQTFSLKFIFFHSW